MRTPVFELHIQPLFRALDREHMRFALDLWDYAQVVQHADDILARVAVDMPTPDTGGPWPAEWVEVFRRWQATGFKRLELGVAQYTWNQAGANATIRATGTFPVAGYRGWLQLEAETEAEKTYAFYFEPPDAPVAGAAESFSLRERYAATDTRAVFMRDQGGRHQIHGAAMPFDMTIVELMKAPPEEHDLDWLKRSLQAAIKLEFATLPPYLCAYWSIVAPADAVAQSIKTIWREEMLHFGLACNLLAAIGGRPEINTPEAVPRYPGLLPGGVHPGLQVDLRALSKESLDKFIEIEFPEGGPIAFALAAEAEEFPTIGAFYNAIEAAFEREQPLLSPDKQLAGALGLRKITTLAEVKQGLADIKRQGEGSNTSPEGTGPNDLAHYYLFREIAEGKRLKLDLATGKYGFNGDPLPFPAVHPMAPVPEGGYQADEVEQGVADLLKQFDEIYTQMLKLLQQAWDTGNASALSDAITTMRDEMPEPALALMQISIPGETGNYGPCFRLQTH